MRCEFWLVRSLLYGFSTLAVCQSGPKTSWRPELTYRNNRTPTGRQNGLNPNWVHLGVSQYRIRSEDFNLIQFVPDKKEEEERNTDLKHWLQICRVTAKVRHFIHSIKSFIEINVYTFHKQSKSHFVRPIGAYSPGEQSHALSKVREQEAKLYFTSTRLCLCWRKSNSTKKSTTTTEAIMKTLEYNCNYK